MPGEFGAAARRAPIGSATLLGWLDGDGRADAPAARDVDVARRPCRPRSGWRRVDTVPDDVIRGLVRHGALTLKEAAEREGVPGAQPRAEVADALLDSIVLTVATDATDDRVEVSLRLLSALVRMGFLARDSHLAIDVGRPLAPAGRRATARSTPSGPGSGLGVVRPRCASTPRCRAVAGPSLERPGREQTSPGGSGTASVPAVEQHRRTRRRGGRPGSPAGASRQRELAVAQLGAATGAAPAPAR